MALFGENWHTTPSFCALAFHNEWEDRNRDVRVNTADEHSTSDENFVNFGPVILSFAGAFVPGGLHAGLTTHF